MTFAAQASRASAAALLASGLWAGQSRPVDARAQRPTVPTTDTSAPTLQELRNATYQGVEEAGGAVTLVNGRWEGKPFVEGGASAPGVTFVGDVRLAGDLDGDGREEAVVLLAASSGGTGEMTYLALVGRTGTQIRNTATARVGDRVQLRDGRIQGRRILLDVVQAGQHDPRCCPGDLVTRSWELHASRLKEGAPARTGRLSLETLAGAEWILRAWAGDEAASARPEVTLNVDGGRLVGSAGCNNYFATVKAGDLPGDLRVGPAGATRKMCPDPDMAVETRFLQQLGRVRQMRFVAGQLALAYSRKNGLPGVMLFERRATP